MSKTTWMTSPDDGQDYAASSPADVARLRAVGYVESTGPGPEQPQAPARQNTPQRPTEGVEKPAPDKS